jgi:hypothetical protein
MTREHALFNLRWRISAAINALQEVQIMLEKVEEKTCICTYLQQHGENLPCPVHNT